MITPHLPVLQVIVPLLAAPLCLLANERRFAWGVSLVAGWTAFVIAALLLGQALDGEIISYELGGWSARWGIEYRVDTVNAFVLLIVSGISTTVIPFTKLSIEKEIHPEQIRYFYCGWLLCLTGLLGIAITGDAFNVFVFLEIPCCRNIQPGTADL